MTEELHNTIQRLRELLEQQQIDQTMYRNLLKGQGLTEAQIQATLSGSDNISVQGSGIDSGDRSIAASHVKGDAFTGDHARKVEAQTHIEQQTNIYGSDSAEVRRAKLEQRYLSRLAHRCNILPLAALGGDESAREEVTLNDIYVSLDTRTRIPISEEEKQQEDRFRYQKERPLSALEAATQHPYLALLGDPGSGKSTFVQQLAARLAQARLTDTETLAGWPPRAWPIFTRLRDLAPRLAGLSLGEPVRESERQQLVEAVKAQWQADLKKLDAADLAENLPDILSREPVVLVFDGLDEVAEAVRRRVRLAVRAVLSAYPAIERVIVTCRIRSYTGPAVLSDFEKQTLAPFDNEKIGRFVEAWYNAQARLGRLSRTQADERTADLARAARSEALRELAANPMLLTTMAIIHQRETKLPNERVRLYDEAVKVLLTRWQSYKEISLSERLQAVLADQLKLRQIMERLAYEVHRSQSQTETDTESEQGDLPRLTALALLEEGRYLGDIGLASEFLDYVDQRAGLLQGRGGEEGRQTTTAYTFPHRTFQEYLAGCQMVAGRSGHASREYWQRVAEGDFWYLAGQLGAEELLYNRRSPESMLDLAYALCPGSEPGDATRWRAVVWSGQMAASLSRPTIEADSDTPDGGRDYLIRLTERLKQSLSLTDLKAIERAEAGRALGLLKADDRPGVGLLSRPNGGRAGEGGRLPDIIWCDVPAGPFIRGSEEGLDSEKPQQTVELPAFKISRYPITNAQFQAFVADGGYQQASYWSEATAVGRWENGQVKRTVYAEGKFIEEWASAPFDYGSPFNLPNHPVVGVSWYEALAFCRWLEEQVANSKLVNWRMSQAQQQVWAAIQSSIVNRQSKITLPSEAEWEKAARGPDGRRYPWGNEPDPERANYDDTGLGTTSAVGCFPGGASPYGVEEMSGNVWEWCRTKWQESYRDYKDDNSLEGEAPRVLRGGAFFNVRHYVRCAFRIRNDPLDRFNFIGIRLVVSPLPSGL